MDCCFICGFFLFASMITILLKQMNETIDQNSSTVYDYLYQETYSKEYKIDT